MPAGGDKAGRSALLGIIHMGPASLLLQLHPYSSSGTLALLGPSLGTQAPVYSLDGIARGQLGPSSGFQWDKAEIANLARLTPFWPPPGGPPPRRFP